MNAPWLFAEAYKYRRLHECFSVSRHWKVRFFFCRIYILQYVEEFGGLVTKRIDWFEYTLTRPQDYDVFLRQKCDTFSRSSEAVFELSTRFVEPFIHTDTDAGKEKERLMFLELAQGMLKPTYHAHSNA
jgi:damage-control phosphatase, subfamily III